MQKKLECIIKILIGITFFVPLIVLPASYIFPFIVPKIIWFRSIVLVMLGLYIVLISSNWERYRIRLTPVNIMVGVFFWSFVVSTFLGVDWYRSFWDNHERMLGLFTMFHYVAFYYIAVSVVRTWDDWKWLLRTFLFAGGIVMIIGFLQTYVNHNLLLNNGGTARVSASLGNSIYFSGYGLFLLFIGYLLAIKEKIQQGSKWMASGWFWYAVVGGLLGFWGIFGGGTRGAFLGLVVGIGVLAIAYLISLKEQKKIKQGIIGLIMLGCIVLGMFYAFRKTVFVQNIPAVGRLVNTEIYGGTSNTRIMAWGVAIEAWKERPVFGWGPNNYYYAFNKHYNPKFLEHGWGETWFDNAHSVIMNTIAVQGVVGIIAYLGMFISAIVMLWKKYKEEKVDAHVFSIGIAFLLAHLASLVTVFDNPTSYLYFFLFLAFVSVSIEGKHIEKKESGNKQISVGLVSVVSLFVLLFIFSTNISPARANQATLDVIRALNAEQDITAMYEQATGINSPHIDDIRNDVSRSSYNVILKLSQNKKNAEALKLFELAHTELQKNIILHPKDIRVHLQLAQLNTLGAQLKNDIGFIIEAESLLEEALSFSVKRQQVQYALYLVKMQLQKQDDAIAILKDSIENNPNIGEGWWRLAMVYKQMGDIDKAKEVIEDAESRGVVFKGQGQKVVEDILQSN
jgi:O-antigen ligase